MEGVAGESAGFGWLDMHTHLRARKQLHNVEGTLCLEHAPVRGYEIHAGVSEGAALDHPAVVLEHGRRDGAISPDGQILGSYLHGLFEHPGACAALLRWAGVPEPLRIDHAARREQMLERLADAVAQSIDVPRLLPLLPASGAMAR